MKRLIFYFLLLGFFSFAVLAQEEKIDLSKPEPSPTPTTTVADFNWEIEGLEKLSVPETILGKVVDVHDGDTLTLLDADKKQYKIRFNGIDAPELHQDFGNKSKENLAKMIFGKEVKVVISKADKTYGRSVGNVFINGIDVNLQQVKDGFAWHYKKYELEQPPEDRKTYSEAEINARKAGLGIWKQPNPTPPWAWRRGENNPNVEGVPKTAVIGNTNSQIYHTPGCSSWARVSPQNRIIFNTEKEAIAKGYRISGQCTSTLPVEERPKVTTTETKRVYQTGSRGGCYYLSPSGKKNYVDKSYCN